jgi:hypothetical protein
LEANYTPELEGEEGVDDGVLDRLFVKTLSLNQVPIVYDYMII